MLRPRVQVNYILTTQFPRYCVAILSRALIRISLLASIGVCLISSAPETLSVYAFLFAMYVLVEAGVYTLGFGAAREVMKENSERADEEFKQRLEAELDAAHEKKQQELRRQEFERQQLERYSHPRARRIAFEEEEDT